MVAEYKYGNRTYTERDLLDLLLKQSETVRTLQKKWMAEKVTAHRADAYGEFLRAGSQLDNLIYNIKQILQ